MSETHDDDKQTSDRRQSHPGRISVVNSYFCLFHINMYESLITADLHSQSTLCSHFHDTACEIKCIENDFTEIKIYTTVYKPWSPV